MQSYRKYNVFSRDADDADDWFMSMRKYFSAPKEKLEDLIEKKDKLLSELETVEKILRNLSGETISLIGGNMIKRRTDLNEQLDALELRMRKADPKTRLVDW